VRQGEVGHVQTIKVCSRDSPLPTIDYLRTSGTIHWFQSGEGGTFIYTRSCLYQKICPGTPENFLSVFLAASIVMVAMTILDLERHPLLA
jgi:hypothetical protein